MTTAIDCRLYCYRIYRILIYIPVHRLIARYNFALGRYPTNSDEQLTRICQTTIANNRRRNSARSRFCQYSIISAAAEIMGRPINNRDSGS